MYSAGKKLDGLSTTCNLQIDFRNFLSMAKSGLNSDRRLDEIAPLWYKVHFENMKRTYGLPGPKKILWLDYSNVTGPPSLMSVSRPGEDFNVRLVWEVM